MPLCLAIRRELQWVAPLGVLSSVRTITASTCSSVILRFSAGLRLVVQAIRTTRDEPPPPLADGRLINAELRGHLLVLGARGAGQHDARAHRQRLRRGSTPCQRNKRPPLVIAQLHFRCAPRHYPSPLISEPLAPIMARISEPGH